MLAYEYSHSEKDNGYIILTTFISKQDYLSYKVSESQTDLKHYEKFDERSRFVLRIAPKEVPFNWIDKLASIISDTIDILAEIYPEQSSNPDFMQLLRTLLFDWSKGVSYEEIYAMVQVICHRFETNSTWQSIEGRELYITTFGSDPIKLLTITTDGNLSHYVTQLDETLQVHSNDGKLNTFKGVGLEQLQRAYVCTFLFSEFQI